MRNSTLWSRLVEKATTDKGIRAALLDRTRHNYGEGQVEPDTLSGWFYAIKAAICLKFNRQFYRDEESEDYLYGYVDGIEVGWHSGASYWSMDCMNAYGWNTVYVGHGIFKNWWAEDVYDTNC